MGSGISCLADGRTLCEIDETVRISHCRRTRVMIFSIQLMGQVSYQYVIATNFVSQKSSLFLWSIEGGYIGMGHFGRGA